MGAVTGDGLVRTPEAVCREIKGFLGLGDGLVQRAGDGGFRVSSTERGIHGLVQDDPRADRIDGWREELPEWRRYVIEHAAELELAALGYDVHRSEAPVWKRMAWRARAHVERMSGFLRWSIRRLRPYGPRLVVRLSRLRLKAWLAARRSMT